MAKKPASDTFTFDELCKAVGLKASYSDAEDLIKFNTDYIFEVGYFVYEEAINDGLDEDAADEARMKAQEKMTDKVMRAYVDTAVETIEDQLGEHFALNLIELTEKNKKGKYTEQRRWKVKPLRTWNESLGLIIQTINGIGYFYFASIGEFLDTVLDSGPYTEREGCLTHLHYLSDHAEVYGGQSLKRQFEQSLEDTMNRL